MSSVKIGIYVTMEIDSVDDPNKVKKALEKMIMDRVVGPDNEVVQDLEIFLEIDGEEI